MAFLRRVAGDRSGRLFLSHFRSARSNPPSLAAPEDSISITSRSRITSQFVVARFLAIPSQGKPKEDLKSSQGPRLNEAITAKFVRLVTEEGHAIVSRDEALDRARKLDVDLVEVQRMSNPPVCKIMDYHKERFKKDTMEKERAKTKSESKIRKGDFKEVRLKGKIAQNDIEVKAEAVKGLLERGYRVKVMALPSKQRGGEESDLEALLNRLIDLIEDVISVESGPFLEKQQAYVVVRHIKFASKKGTRKKAIAATAAPVATANVSVVTESDSETEPEDDVITTSSPVTSTILTDKPAKVFDQRSSGGNEPGVSNPSNIPRRQENPNRQSMNSKENSSSQGDSSPAPSYGIFSAPKRPVSNADRRR